MLGASSTLDNYIQGSLTPSIHYQSIPTMPHMSFRLVFNRVFLFAHIHITNSNNPKTAAGRGMHNIGMGKVTGALG